MRCHDCNVKEGEIHEMGCDTERCPVCGGQFISCECEDAVVNKQTKLTGRIPYIHWPWVCARCGVLDPDMFMIPDEEYHKYVEIGERDKIICRRCYNKIKKLIDK
jgi:hypothetical protein